MPLSLFRLEAAALSPAHLASHRLFLVRNTHSHSRQIGEPVAVAYTKVYGVPMGRYYRPVAAWPGDIELLPHLKGILACGAIDVDVCFGEAVEYRADTNRKQVSAAVADRIRTMLSDSLLGRRAS